MLPTPTAEQYTSWTLEEQRAYDADYFWCVEQERQANLQTLSFHDYIREFWPVIEPSTPFIDNWTTGALAEHLTACYNREIRKLVINIFFRSAKSTITSVLFPSWVWKENPAERFLCASFSGDLALRDAYHCRNLIESPEYQKAYGHLYKISSDQSAKGYYENDKMGARRSIGTNAQTTGFGGSIRILDDPNDTNKSESKQIRDNANEWFKKTWSSRSDDFTKDVSIIIQQRTHKNDVTGHIIENGLDYELLKIPLEYTGKKYFTSIYSDPREVVGESADPVRFPPEVIKDLKKTLGIAYHGQAQQEPVSPEGDVIKRAWYNDRYALPIAYTEGKWVWSKSDIIGIQGYTDLAGSDSPDSDRTANVVKIQLADGKIIKLWQHSGRWTPLPRNTEILNFYSAWNQVFPGFQIHIESNSILGQSGMDDLRNMLLAKGLNVRKDYAKVSKTDRAINQKDSYIANAEAQRIEFYQGDLFNELMKPYGAPQQWKSEFFEESCSLYYDDNGNITGDHDDLLDDDVGCFNKLTKPKPTNFFAQN